MTLALLVWLDMNFGQFDYSTLLFRTDGSWPYVRWGYRDSARVELQPFTALTFPA